MATRAQCRRSSPPPSPSQSRRRPARDAFATSSRAHEAVRVGAYARGPGGGVARGRPQTGDGGGAGGGHPGRLQGRENVIAFERLLPQAVIRSGSAGARGYAAGLSSQPTAQGARSIEPRALEPQSTAATTAPGGGRRVATWHVYHFFD